MKKTLETLRRDEHAGILWRKVTSKEVELDVLAPSLPRKRKLPIRYEESNAAPEFLAHQSSTTK